MVFERDQYAPCFALRALKSAIFLCRGHHPVSAAVRTVLGTGPESVPRAGARAPAARLEGGADRHPGEAFGVRRGAAGVLCVWVCVWRGRVVQCNSRKEKQ